jgi:hypothetical protein
LIDPRKLEQLATRLDELLASAKKGEKVERGDLQHYFRRLDKKFNKGKKSYQQHLEGVFREFTTFNPETMQRGSVT